MVEQVVGIDVSKAKLDVALLPGGEQFTVSNDRHGIGELLRRVSPLAPSRVVLEATGKLEQLAVSELAAAGLPVVVINPAQVRHYAKARGKWAKTDPIDARLIAEFARDLEPELRPLPDGRDRGAEMKSDDEPEISKEVPAKQRRWPTTIAVLFFVTLAVYLVARR